MAWQAGFAQHKAGGFLFCGIMSYRDATHFSSIYFVREFIKLYSNDIFVEKLEITLTKVLRTEIFDSFVQ
jgi:hypothetical protein